jgi:hypothetical protein
MKKTRFGTTMTTLMSASVLVAVSSVALAQAPKPAPMGVAPAAAPAAPAATAAPAHPAPPAPPPSAAGPPKAPAELDQIKWVEGNWRCEGKAPAGPMGPEHPYKSTMKIKRDLDGFWYVSEYEQKKSKENPVPIKARGFISYDAVAKKIVSVGIDNMGGALQLSGALEADKISTSGEGSNGGQKFGFKEIISKTGDRALTWHGELRMGKDWMIVGDDSCKR